MGPVSWGVVSFEADVFSFIKIGNEAASTKEVHKVIRSIDVPKNFIP